MQLKVKVVNDIFIFTLKIDSFSFYFSDKNVQDAVFNFHKNF
jgi:hypothetical protein